jgi:hypothetical protein
MGWIIPSFGSMAAGAADETIRRERRRGRRRNLERTPPTPSVDEQELIDKIIRLPLHVRVERGATHRPFKPPRDDG